jgi:hypothetical protein
VSASRPPSAITSNRTAWVRSGSAVMWLATLALTCRGWVEVEGEGLQGGGCVGLRNATAAIAALLPLVVALLPYNAACEQLASTIGKKKPLMQPDQPCGMPPFPTQ